VGLKWKHLPRKLKACIQIPAPTPPKQIEEEEIRKLKIFFFKSNFAPLKHSD
jgi:hypothetical protein